MDDGYFKFGGLDKCANALTSLDLANSQLETALGKISFKDDKIPLSFSDFVGLKGLSRTDCLVSKLTSSINFYNEAIKTTLRLNGYEFTNLLNGNESFLIVSQREVNNGTQYQIKITITGTRSDGTTYTKDMPFNMYVPNDLQLDGSASLTMYYPGMGGLSFSNPCNEGPSSLPGMILDGRAGFGTMSNGILLIPADYEFSQNKNNALAVQSVMSTFNVNENKVSVYGFSYGGKRAVIFANYCYDHREEPGMGVNIANVMLQSSADGMKMDLHDEKTAIDAFWGAGETGGAGEWSYDNEEYESKTQDGGHSFNFHIEITANENYSEAEQQDSHGTTACPAIHQRDFGGHNSIELLTSYEYGKDWAIVSDDAKNYVPSGAGDAEAGSDIGATSIATSGYASVADLVKENYENSNNEVKQTTSYAPLSIQVENKGSTVTLNLSSEDVKSMKELFANKPATEQEIYEANQIIQGKGNWGNGEARIEQYKQEGLDPNRMQTIIRAMDNDGKFVEVDTANEFNKVVAAANNIKIDATPAPSPGPSATPPATQTATPSMASPSSSLSVTVENKGSTVTLNLSLEEVKSMKELFANKPATEQEIYEANQIIQGKGNWGNGEARIEQYKQEGLDPNRMQTIIRAMDNAGKFVEVDTANEFNKVVAAANNIKIDVTPTPSPTPSATPKPTATPTVAPKQTEVSPIPKNNSKSKIEDRNRIAAAKQDAYDAEERSNAELNPDKKDEEPKNKVSQTPSSSDIVNSSSKSSSSINSSSNNSSESTSESSTSSTVNTTTEPVSPISNWPDNSFTKDVPIPNFGVTGLPISTTNNNFLYTIYGCDSDDILNYRELLRKLFRQLNENTFFRESDNMTIILNTKTNGDLDLIFSK